MALINNLYINVTEEQKSWGVQVTEHPVEEGLPLTDNVKPKARVLSLTGNIVMVGLVPAKAIVTQLEYFHHNAKYVKYIGVESFSNALITDFSIGRTNKIHGGCTFSMEITEVRIAKAAYVAKGNKVTGKQTQVKKNTTSPKYHIVKKGDCLWNIAKKYYGNGANWKKIFEANKKLIKNANLIFPGQKFLIP